MSKAPVPGESRAEDPRFCYSTNVNRRGGEFREGEGYCPELRQRVVLDYKSAEHRSGQLRPHGLLQQVADAFRIDPRTVKRWVDAWDEERRLTPLAKGTTNYAKVEHAHLRYLEEFMNHDVTPYLWELAQFMADDLGGKVSHPKLSESTVWRLLRDELGLSFKKLSMVALQQSSEENDKRRTEFLTKVGSVEPDAIGCADEMGANYNSGLRQRGWGPQHGETRAVDFKAKKYAPNHSVIAFMSQTGIEQIGVTKGAANGEDWWTFWCQAEELLASRRFKVVVLDNSSVHVSMHDQVEALLAQYDIKLVYLPPYSPDLNPIEEVFSKVKKYLQDHREDLQADIVSALVAAFESITEEDCKGYYRLYI